MADALYWVKVAIAAQFFYAFSFTLLAYYLVPMGIGTQIESFQEPVSNLDVNNVTEQVKTSLNQQTKIPLVDLGSLLFYTGNFLIDFVLNFFFAIPQMATLLISGILQLINVTGFIQVQIKLYVGAAIFVFYMFSLISMITNIRSGRIVG